MSLTDMCYIFQPRKWRKICNVTKTIGRIVYVFESIFFNIIFSWKILLVLSTVKPAHVVTSIKQSPVLKGHVCSYKTSLN